MARGNGVLTGVKTSSTVVRTVIVVALAIFLVTGWIYWRQIFNSPRNVFNSMLENSLRTRSVGKHVEQSNGQQDLSQNMQLQTGQNNIVNSRTILSQSGGQSADVYTESIGTPSEDYVRYTDIQTTQRGQSGRPLDFSKIIGVWGQSETFGGDITTSGELFGEVVLGIVPFGYIEPAQRAAILKIAQEGGVYEVDFDKVETARQNGRPVYTYEVEIRPENYVKMLKEFARSAGLTQLETFDPASFKDSPALKAKMTVDIWSRQLVKIELLDSGRIETYTAYGAKLQVNVPEQSIPVSELQQRLQSVR